AAAHTGADRFIRMNVRDRPTVYQLAVLRIVIRGPEWLHDRHAEPAMRPGRCAECMVMPEHSSHIHVYPPPIADEFRGHKIACRMGLLQRLEERHLIALDLLDPGDFRATLVTRQ